MFLSSAKTSTAPGWEDALRALVAADNEFIASNLPDEADAALAKIQNSLFKLQGILGYVAHALVVPEDIGQHMMSLTEGWENFWLDYDMLTAVHSPGIIPIDQSIPSGSAALVSARTRLVKAMPSDVARSVYVCARITSVDILLRQPKKSAVFLNSYFQTFPSFICQTASLANLMVNRSLHQEIKLQSSIESMIAFAAVSLLATIVCETNHVTQALSVLSANNPHSGLLASLLSLTLGPCLPFGAATANMSKGAVYLLLCSIQNAKHPSSISSPPILRKILETLVNPLSHPDVIHACCICLEVSLEFCPSAFAVLFRDLDALDRLVDCGVRIMEDKLYERSLSSIFSLLRFSFQTQEIHVGINLHEKLTIPSSPMLNLFITVLKNKNSKGPFNGCMTLVGNVIADDPMIISTMAEVGIVEAIVHASRLLQADDPKENISAAFVAICALCLHETGIKKLAEFGEPLTDLLSQISGNKFQKATKLPEEEYGMEENRMNEDLGMVIGQSCDDVLRNKVEFSDKLIGAVISGMENVLNSENTNIAEDIVPGLRILYTGFLATSSCVSTFIAKGGMHLLNKVLEHPRLEPNCLLKPIVGSGRPHAIVSVFRQIGQRGPQPKLLCRGDQFATACLLMNSAVQGIHQTVSEDFIAFMTEFWKADLLEQRKDELGWTAIKNFLSTVARITNSVSGPTRIVDPTCFALAHMQADGLKRMMLADPDGEMVDVLSRCFVEDKNHSLRPVSVLFFFRLGGIELLAEWIRNIVHSGVACTYLEPLLILFERLTSVKRMTNSPITKELQKNAPNFNPDALSGSITAVLGQTCFDLHSHFLEIPLLSTTSATAIIKIYSHTVMLSEARDPEGDRPGKKQKKSIQTSDFSNWVEGPEVRRIGQQVAAKFLDCCIELGDKGGCDAAVAELIARHADYLGVDITAKRGKRELKETVETSRKSTRIAKRRS